MAMASIAHNVHDAVFVEFCSVLHRQLENAKMRGVRTYVGVCVCERARVRGWFFYWVRVVVM